MIVFLFSHSHRDFICHLDIRRWLLTPVSLSVTEVKSFEINVSFLCRRYKIKGGGD